MEEFNDTAAASIAVLPEGCISDILSLTSPRDASQDSDAAWEHFLPSDYRQLISRAVSPVVFQTKKELYTYLSKSYVLLDRGTLGFKLDKDSGKKCYMLGAKDLSTAYDNRYWQREHLPESRFAEVGIVRQVWWLDICGIIPSVMLSPKSTYVAYLVYQISGRRSTGLDVPGKSTVTFGGVRNDTSNVYLKLPQTWPREEAPTTHVAPTTRKDGWMEIKLGELYHDDADEGDVEMKFQNYQSWKSGLYVEGIELRPK